MQITQKANPLFGMFPNNTPKVRSSGCSRKGHLEVNGWGFVNPVIGSTTKIN